MRHSRPTDQTSISRSKSQSKIHSPCRKEKPQQQQHFFSHWLFICREVPGLPSAGPLNCCASLGRPSRVLPLRLRETATALPQPSQSGGLHFSLQVSPPTKFNLLHLLHCQSSTCTQSTSTTTFSCRRCRGHSLIEEISGSPSKADFIFATVVACCICQSLAVNQPI